MRLLVDLEATADAVYDHTYHHKLRGRVWNAFENTEYDEKHDAGEPLGLTFSNPFPWEDISEGDSRHLLFAAHEKPLLTPIVESLQTNPELNIGEMSFHVEDIRTVEPDVGEPGTSGVIESGTGVVCHLYEDTVEKYGIEPEGNQDPFWKSGKHPMGAFKDRVRQNLQYKHELFRPEYMTGPNEFENSLFDSYECIKKYPLPVTVTTGVEKTFILTKWKLGYTVRNDAHRRLLNFALDVGLGERNNLGFGFINITQKDKC